MNKQMIYSLSWLFLLQLKCHWSHLDVLRFKGVDLQNTAFNGPTIDLFNAEGFKSDGQKIRNTSH